ncbi:hypothetical protein ACKKBG_A33560 [Auxenochlorella protothecoides x Auxenochlorella symbiontica]
MSLAHLGSRMAVGRGLALSTKSRLPRLPAGHAHSTSAVQVFCAAQESSRMEGGRSSAAEKLIRGHIAAATTVGGLLLSEASPALAAAPGNAGKAALAAAAAWFLLPPALRLLGSGFRGYAGEIAPAAALNELSGWRDGVLVDLRSDREKSVAGVPDLPSAGKLVEVEYAEIGDRRARGALRDPGSLEAEVTAMQVAGLKRAKRGSPIYLLDKNGSVAKTVAKNLARQGFKRVYVVSGGFQGWQNAKLQIKPSSSVSPFDILLPGTGKYSARQTTSTRPQGRRALPSGR